MIAGSFADGCRRLRASRGAWAGRWVRGIAGALAVSATAGCAGLATNAAADALSGTGGVFAKDDDPELIADAAPFGLKTMEAVLEETPEHEGLLLSLASGYTQYAYAFLAEKADVVRDEAYERAEHLDRRARGLYQRGLRYGLRGLELRHEQFGRRLREAPDALSAELSEEDVPFLYWSAAAWGLSIAASGFAPDEIADFPLAMRMAEWALRLDEAFDDGAIHTLLLTFESASPNGSLDRAEEHFERALALDGGRRAGTFVSMAENVCVKRQNVVRFHELLERALAIEVDDHPDDRLVNVIMQRRARRLLDREEDLFLVPLDEARSAASGSES